MDKKTVIPNWVGILFLVLVIVGIVWTTFSMSMVTPPDGHRTESVINHICTLILMFVALLYCVSGYKKAAAPYYELYVYIYTATSLISSIITREGPEFLPVLSTLSFGLLMVLAFARDFGIKNTMIFCAANVLVSIARLVAYIIYSGQLPGGLFANLLASAVLGLMAYAKYADKTARGTK